MGDFHLDNVACTPQWNAGDIVIIRGDTLHRTQPHDSARVSLCVRVFQQRFNIDSMFTGGITRYMFFYHSLSHYVNLAVKHSGPTDTIVPLAWLRELAVRIRVDMGIRIGLAYRQALLPFRRWSGR